MCKIIVDYVANVAKLPQRTNMKYSCQKHGIIGEDDVGIGKVCMDPNNPEAQAATSYLVCKKCNGVVEDRVSYCNVISKRWRELKGKLPVARMIIPGQLYEMSSISTEEAYELDRITRQLSEEYWDLLSLSDKFDIDKNRFIRESEKKDQ